MALIVRVLLVLLARGKSPESEETKKLLSEIQGALQRMEAKGDETKSAVEAVVEKVIVEPKKIQKEIDADWFLSKRSIVQYALGFLGAVLTFIGAILAYPNILSSNSPAAFVLALVGALSGSILTVLNYFWDRRTDKIVEKF